MGHWPVGQCEKMLMSQPDSTIVSMSVFPNMHLTIEPNCGSVLGNERWRVNVEMRLIGHFPAILAF